MQNPFFTALESDEFSSSELGLQTNKVLMPFRHYIENSIKALEDKEVTCNWEPVANRRYELTPNVHIYQLTPVSDIEILSEQEGWYEIVSEVDGTLLNEGFFPEIDDPVIVGKGENRQRFKLIDEYFQCVNHQYKLYLPDISEVRVIQWSGYQLLIRPLSVELGELTEVHIDSFVCPVQSIKNNVIRLHGQVNRQSLLSINGQNTRFKLISSFESSLIDNYFPVREGNGWLFFTNKKLQGGNFKLKNITHKLFDKLTPEHLCIDDKPFSDQFWGVEASKEGLLLSPSDVTVKEISGDSQILCSGYPALHFSVKEVNIDEKWIQLIEIDSAIDNGKSELDYFFEDRVKVLDQSQGKRDDGYQVIKSRPDERQILLARNIKGKKNWKSEYPAAQGRVKEIRVSVDTSQLKRQKEAINQLMCRPNVGHAPLIHLLQDRKRNKWENVSPVKDINWQVLTNADFDGCDRQREFVSKALATPDFAILDGPPGTGKTTTILELIIQLVFEGKKILLSASTHAAINNVLERVKEDVALSKYIFPLRIGYESNAIGVEEYHFDKVYQHLQSGSGCDDFSKQLMIESSNLVCGTTIGILKLFNEREVDLDKGEPPYDVMIIDECSKTTFQEFLVPARFAKRWILVGDVRQLSPFTDREQIVANLDNLMISPGNKKKAAKTLSSSVQRACYLLEELRGNRDKPYQQPMLVPVSSSVLQALASEVIARKKDKDLSAELESILLIQNKGDANSAASCILNVGTIMQKPWYLYIQALFFIDEACLDKIQLILPDDIVILHPDWQRTGHAFAHKASGLEKVKNFEVKTTNYSDSNSLNQSLLERIDDSKWSEEVCWRLEREYWLRLSANYENKTRYLSTSLKRLFPKSINVDGRIHILKNIAFPSILEALSGDGLVKRRNDNPTTLNQGFNLGERYQRHSTLSYQHRMHPDISTFSREQFYPKGVLLDGSQTRESRKWEYERYKTRNTWLNVAGKIFKNANQDEVQAVVKNLKAFCDWAEKKKKNEKGEPFDVAVLTFYKGQEKALRSTMQKELPGNNNCYARFNYKGISIKLATVDYFQGQEADLVFLSMVNTSRDGFMDSPNRLNVSITRARYQLVIVGDHHYFSQRSRTQELKALANSCCVHGNRNSSGKNITRNRNR